MNAELFIISILAFLLIGYTVGRLSHSEKTTIKSAQKESPSPTVSVDVQVADNNKDVIFSPAPIVQIAKHSSASIILHKQLGALDLSTIEIRHTPEFDRAIEIIEKGDRCIFITGEAGTGKSTLLKYFVANTNKRVVVLAYTGVAALNVGGQTIHSFFQFPRGAINKITELFQKGELLRLLDAIVIDEISMVRADLLDAVDQSLRVNRRKPREPFGGVQMIFVGDLFQLPPVVKEKEEGQYFSQYYGSPYFFDAHVFKEIDITLVKLTTIYRQSDPLFTEILNLIRVKRMTDDHLQILNERVNPQFEPAESDGYIVLTTTNKRADEKNQRELSKLSLPENAYQATVVGEFAESQYPTDYRLRLRKGSQVMFLNNDIGKRWVNGTVGIVEQLYDNSVLVKIPAPSGQPDHLCEVGRHTWSVSRYRINHTSQILESELIGSFTQIPLRLAWAITIHKSQGKKLLIEQLLISPAGLSHMGRPT